MIHDAIYISCILQPVSFICFVLRISNFSLTNFSVSSVVTRFKNGSCQQIKPLNGEGAVKSHPDGIPQNYAWRVGTELPNFFQ